MCVSVDPITRRKLILVKQLYNHAVVQSAMQHSTMRRILAVAIFDLTIETALRAIVTSLDSSRSPSDTFEGLIQQSDSLLSDSACIKLPDKANIRHVHSLRNDAQHKAKYPNQSDVSDCRTYARDFLHKTLAGVWGLDFERVSLTDVIQDTEAKQVLTEAEAALSQGQYQEAVQRASVGLTLALNRVQAVIVGRLPTMTGGFVLTDAFNRPMSDSAGRDTFRAFARMREAVLYLALGMNYAEYIEYVSIAGHTYQAGDGKFYSDGGKEIIEASDAQFVVAYCTESVAEIEGRVGSLDAPFGGQHWYRAAC